MPIGSPTIDQTLALLAVAPQRLSAATDGLSEGKLHTCPNDSEWSANDVLAHLRACADVWGNCILTIIAQEKPTLRAVNPRVWIKKTNYLELEFLPSLRAFATQHTELVTVLESLPHAGWSRSATVTGAGKVLERTVKSYARWLARHERPHLKQIERIVNSTHG